MSSFDAFLAFVQAQAQSQGSIFVLDSGEGCEMEDPPKGMTWRICLDGC